MIIHKKKGNQYNMQNPQQNQESKGIFQNIKEKILQPMKHDTDTNITHPTKEHNLDDQVIQSATNQPRGDTFTGVTGPTSYGTTTGIPRDENLYK